MEITYYRQSARLLQGFIFIGGGGWGRASGIGSQGREWIGAFDDPTKGEKREAGEYSGSPGLRVPPAVLSNCEAPLVSEGGGIRDPCLPGIGIIGASAAVAADFRRRS